MTSKKLKEIEFDKVCRTCLNKGRQMKVFNKQIIEIVVTCAGLHINENDGLPNNICNRCFMQLNRFFMFKKRIEKCQAKLEKIVNERNKAKKNKRIITIDGLKSNVDFEASIEDNIEFNQRKIPQTRSITKQIDQKALQISVENYEIVLKKDESAFSAEPPPLVPLVPIAPEEIPVYPVEKQGNPVEIALRPLSDETPPLIPIKPTAQLVLIKPLPVLDALSTAMANSNIIVANFSCPNCTEEFTDPLELKQHVTQQHSKQSLLICNICKKEFADRNRLIGHLKGHTVQKLYACKICNKRYPNPSTFKVHMRTHTGERPFKCQVCNKGFVRWAGVVGHMKSHNEAKPYECDICQRGFKMQSNLERHKILHTGEMPFCCSYCGKTFTQNDNLQLHVRTYHTNERPYLCNECGKSFVSSTRLKRHMWVHTGYKRYMCQHCPKSYSNSNDLKIHNNRTHGGGDEQDKPYACAVCDMRFFHPCRLARHMKTHDRPYACTECSRTFSREELLNQHIFKKHSGDSCGKIVEEVVIDNADSKEQIVKIEYIKSFDIETVETVEEQQ